MISELRTEFNRQWSPEQYRRLLSRMDARCGAHIGFRVCETPVFIPRDLVRLMEEAGGEIMMRLAGDPRYREASEHAVPARYRAPREEPHPLFAALDFGIVRNPDGRLIPRLVELQAFPSLYAYQPVLCQEYGAVYDLPGDLTQYAGGMDAEAYETLFRSAILGSKVPENVVLMEIDPPRQQTLPDSLLTSKLCGIPVVDMRDMVRRGRRLYYRKGSMQIPVDRIYNRVNPGDLEKSRPRPKFALSDDIDVEWAGHPAWFFRLSRFSLPFITHPLASPSVFLSDVDFSQVELRDRVLKPLFPVTGGGVTVSPRRSDIDAIKPSRRQEYILQENVEYAGVVATPAGPATAEVRILYIWHDRPVPVLNLVRLGRGPAAGVDRGRTMDWAGASAGFWPA
jgi:hypothetical protein